MYEIVHSVHHFEITIDVERQWLGRWGLKLKNQPRLPFKYAEHNLKILLFKSLRNSKRCNKGNFTSKSNSNKL